MFLLRIFTNMLMPESVNIRPYFVVRSYTVIHSYSDNVFCYDKKFENMNNMNCMDLHVAER
jgi:hypothetical protein